MWQRGGRCDEAKRRGGKGDVGALREAPLPAERSEATKGDEVRKRRDAELSLYENDHSRSAYRLCIIRSFCLSFRPATGWALQQEARWRWPARP